MRNQGLQFDLHLCIEKDPSLLSDVSRALGHKDTHTTEAYYGKINVGAALDRLEQAFMAAEDQSTVPSLPLRTENRVAES